MTGWRTSISLQPFVQTRLDCGSLLCTSISLHPVFQTCLDCGSLSAHTHQYPALCFKHVWIMVPCLCASISLQPFNQTRLDCGPCCSQASFLVCVHASVPDPCLCARIRSHPCSNTFDYGCLFVYLHLCLEPKWLRVTWIIPCKCLMFHAVGMVMGSSMVALMPLPFPYESDGDPSPRGVGFRLSPSISAAPFFEDSDHSFWGCSTSRDGLA